MPAAGPLPSKIGELGYNPQLPAALTSNDSAHVDRDTNVLPSPTETTLPARHPAESPPPSRPTSPHSSRRSSAASRPAAPTSTPNRAASNAADSEDARSTQSKSSLLSFIRLPSKLASIRLLRSPGRSRKTRKFYGVRLKTIVKFFLHLFFIGGTIAAWVLLVKFVNYRTSAPASSDTASDPNGTGPGTSTSASTTIGGGGTANVFVHVAFAVATLIQLIFLERCSFRIRAERYAHTHPGSFLPRHYLSHPSSSSTLSMDENDPALTMAPWNRPPIPTYAAALAESGRLGTGDVEDHVIAVPPPPAYGNTRGSMLLLSGILTDAQRSQRPRQASRDGEAEGDLSRPQSYTSELEADWQERTNAERARQLEAALSRLEAGAAVSLSRAP